MRSPVLALAALACLHVAAAQQIGDEVEVMAVDGQNYFVYTTRGGDTKVTQNSFGLLRRATVVDVSAEFARTRVIFAADGTSLSGVNGWVETRHVRVIAEPDPPTGKARLTWFYAAGDEETGDLFSFMVERQERPGPPVNWMPIHETEPFAIPEGGTTYSWLDTGVDIGKTYAWRVRARRRYGPSDTWAVSNWSNEAQHTVTDEETVVPLAPANLTTEQLEP